MTTPEDIDAFFDALVDGACAEGDQQQSQLPPPLQPLQQDADAGSSRGAPLAGEHLGLPVAPTEGAVSGGPAAEKAAVTGIPASTVAAISASAPPTASSATASAEPSQPALFRPPDKQFPGISSTPSLLQRPQQQQRQQDGYLGEPPELSLEPPYDYRPYGGTEEGRQRHAADAEAQTAALCSSALAVSRLIESKLKENEQMLFAVHENMTVGRYDEALCYFERLQQNLLFLAMLADQHRGGLTETSVEAQQQDFYANRDFWSHEELQRLHHALRTPGQDLQQLAAAVGSKSSAQILSYLSHAADRHLMHRAAAGPAAAAAALTAATPVAAVAPVPGTAAAIAAPAAIAAARPAQQQQALPKPEEQKQHAQASQPQGITPQQQHQMAQPQNQSGHLQIQVLHDPAHPPLQQLQPQQQMQQPQQRDVAAAGVLPSGVPSLQPVQQSPLQVSPLLQLQQPQKAAPHDDVLLKNASLHRHQPLPQPQELHQHPLQPQQVEQQALLQQQHPVLRQPQLVQFGQQGPLGPSRGAR